jgi:PAS domain S-box-containing protein
MRRVGGIAAAVALAYGWLAAAAPAAAAAGRVGRADAGGPLQRVALALKWYPQFQFAGYYAAQRMGYFAAEGLDVELLEPSNGVYAVEAVLSGRARYGVTSADLVKSRAKGLPLVAVAVVFQHSPIVLLSRMESELRHPADYVGKTVMASEDDLPEIKAMFTKEGIDPARVRFVPHAWSVEPLIAGEVDATVDYATNEPYLLEQRGVQVRMLRPIDYGIDFYGDALFTTEREARRNPERVAAMRRAVQRGWAYALENVDEVAGWILEMPGVRERGKTREHLLYEAEQIALLVQANLVEIGHMNPARWERIARAYLDAGMIERVPPMEGFVFRPGAEFFALRKWTQRVGGALAAALALALGVGYLNHKLRRAVRRKTQELAESEAKWRGYLEGAPYGALIVDDKGRYVDVNAAACEFSGYSREELLGMGIQELLAPEGHEAGLRHFQQVSREGFAVADLPHRIRGGAVRLWQVHARLLSEGRVIGFFRDVTDERRAAEDLRRAKEEAEENETRYQALHNATFGGIAIHDKGLILDCNRGLSTLTGYSVDELIGMNGLLLISENTRERVLGNIVARYEKPYEAVGVRKNGEEYPLRLEAREIPYKGKAVRVVEFRDLTEVRQAEAALRESEEKLRALFSSMTEMVALHELEFGEDGRAANYRITDCNRAFCESTGFDRDAVVGRLATEVYGTSEPPYLEEFGRVALSGMPYVFETYFAPMDRHFYISVVSPGPRRFATVTADVTGMKRIQQAMAEKNKELEQLVYVASHDLRSPLVNVDGYGRELEYAMEEVVAALEGGGPQSVDVLRAQMPGMADALRRIRAGTRQMDALLNGLLKISRLGRAALDVKALDMNQLMARAVEGLAYQIRHTGASVSVGELPPCRGDAQQVAQVFANLLGNALKYLDPAREGRVRIGGSEEGGRAIYFVEDNGLGIAPEHVDKIFEIFYRLDPKLTDGEGLGLAIVRQILARLDGSVWLESVPGAGSRFFVALPKARLPETVEGASEA